MSNEECMCPILWDRFLRQKVFFSFKKMFTLYAFYFQYCWSEGVLLVGRSFHEVDELFTTCR